MASGGYMPRGHTQSKLCFIAGVVPFALYTVDIPGRHSHAQPFKLQLLLSAEGNQKQTHSPRPPLPSLTAPLRVTYFGFPVQSITPLPHLTPGPHPNMLCS